MNKRYESTSALLRYVAALFSLVAFVMLFGKILYTNNGIVLRFREVFFNHSGIFSCAHVYGFIFQLLILLGGAFGVLIPIFNVFVSDEKKYSCIAGGVLVISGIFILLLKVMFAGIEGASDFNVYHLYGTTIAAGCLAIGAGLLNVAAAFIKK